MATSLVKYRKLDSTSHPMIIISYKLKDANKAKEEGEEIYIFHFGEEMFQRHNPFRILEKHCTSHMQI